MLPGRATDLVFRGTQVTPAALSSRQTYAHGPAEFLAQEGTRWERCSRFFAARVHGNYLKIAQPSAPDLVGDLLGHESRKRQSSCPLCLHVVSSVGPAMLR